MSEARIYPSIEVNTRTYRPATTMLWSWIRWRNALTNSVDDMPFSKLAQEKQVPLPLELKDITNNYGLCQFCYGETVVNNKIGADYCLCQMLNYEREITRIYQTIRSPIKDEFFKTFNTTPDYNTNGATLNWRESVSEKDTTRTLVSAKAAATRFAKWPSRWLVMFGGVGCGKTHLLRAISRVFNPLAIYITSRSMEQLVHRFRKDDELDTLHEALKDAPILLLDDIGMEYGGDLIKSMVDGIVDHRYSDPENYPTVLTSNLTATRLREYLPRTGDRVTDKDIADVIGITAPSYRQRGG